MARCIQELKRIKGIRKGSAGKGFLEQDNLTPNVSQSNLANEMNISRQQLREEYSKIARENQLSGLKKRDVPSDKILSNEKIDTNKHSNYASMSNLVYLKRGLSSL